MLVICYKRGAADKTRQAAAWGIYIISCGHPALLDIDPVSKQKSNALRFLMNSTFISLLLLLLQC